jgi:nucleotide-binding universal stress UspA family protein
MSRSILVPVDFTPLTDITIRYANQVAHRIGGEIHLLHIVETPMIEPSAGAVANDFLRRSYEKVEKMTLDKLEDLARANSNASGIKTSYLSSHGSIFEDINKAAEQLQCSCIVMGTHGLTGIQVVAGSFALRILQNANRPFLLVQLKNETWTISRILMELDMLHYSENLLPVFSQLYDLFHCEFLIQYSNEHGKAMAESNKFRLEQFLGSQSIPHHIYTTSDFHFSNKLELHAREQKADLIAVVSPGANGNYGSFEQHVLYNESHLPVMFLKY